MKHSLLLLLLLPFLAACRSSRSSAEFSQTTRTVVSDSASLSRTIQTATDSGSVLTILTIDSLTLAAEPSAVVPDTTAMQAMTTTERAALPSALRPLKVYGLRVLVHQTGVKKSVGDSLSTSAQSAVNNQVVTHAEDVTKYTAPSTSYSWAIILVAILGLFGLSWFLYKKHIKA